MIFVTVGTQLPFPRLLDAMNALAPELTEPVVAQTCAAREADNAAWPALEARSHMPPDLFDARFSEARLIVAHAGIGTILSARRWGKSLVLLPRRHALGEHRNDHQIATARQVEVLEGVHVAWQVSDLPGLILGTDLQVSSQRESAEHDRLVARLRQFILS
ncbi:glycosyltransferase family 28 protein [Meridianimarinicoccus roseus]|uniref:Glycosyltransferase family 28 protein n=1 Tax=Meridianimarinicoccus roseus TaxID=2072018 RepID=A0A2V2L942_9RHOB|nr:glycosyltransferase [Meridianimarinicoccus roseus]PWR01968.1 glycosyltransferase family 28 protein [Meridianimarinicoccus roseus]